MVGIDLPVIERMGITNNTEYSLNTINTDHCL